MPHLGESLRLDRVWRPDSGFSCRAESSRGGNVMDTFVEIMEGPDRRSAHGAGRYAAEDRSRSARGASASTGGDATHARGEQPVARPGREPFRPRAALAVKRGLGT